MAVLVLSCLGHIPCGPSGGAWNHRHDGSERCVGVRLADCPLDAELYDDAIPFEDTARRLIAVSEVAAQVITSNVTRLPRDAAHLLALSVQAVYRRDLLAARDFIIDALRSRRGLDAAHGDGTLPERSR